MQCSPRSGHARCSDDGQPSASARIDVSVRVHFACVRVRHEDRAEDSRLLSRRPVAPHQQPRLAADRAPADVRARWVRERAVLFARHGAPRAGYRGPVTPARPPGRPVSGAPADRRPDTAPGQQRLRGGRQRSQAPPGFMGGDRVKRRLIETTLTGSAATARGGAALGLQRTYCCGSCGSSPFTCRRALCRTAIGRAAGRGAPSATITLTLIRLRFKGA